jgi:hypothetical protein
MARRSRRRSRRSINGLGFLGGGSLILWGGVALAAYFLLRKKDEKKKADEPICVDDCGDKPAAEESDKTSKAVSDISARLRRELGKRGQLAPKDSSAAGVRKRAPKDKTPVSPEQADCKLRGTC